MEEQEGGRMDPGEWEFGTSPNEKKVGKGCGEVNIVQILCTHVCKWKIDTC
jgi:hypothetical protein